MVPRCEKAQPWHMPQTPTLWRPAMSGSSLVLPVTRPPKWTKVCYLDLILFGFVCFAYRICTPFAKSVMSVFSEFLCFLFLTFSARFSHPVLLILSTLRRGGSLFVSGHRFKDRWRLSADVSLLETWNTLLWPFCVLRALFIGNNLEFLFRFLTSKHQLSAQDHCTFKSYHSSPAGPHLCVPGHWCLAMGRVDSPQWSAET